YSNTTGMLIDISERVKAVGVTPVPMMWNVAGVRVTEKLVEAGLFKEPLFCEVSVFGEPYLGFGHPATVKGLDTIVDFFPEGSSSAARRMTRGRSSATRCFPPIAMSRRMMTSLRCSTMFAAVSVAWMR